jgi:hypothetical protein
MTIREKQIDEFANSQVDCEFFNEDLYEGIIIGAKWADEHPDSKHTYTKQQLMDMGFAFTTNGDIVTPDQLNEHLKKYLKYQKRKFIEKAVKYLEANFPDIENVGGCYKESFINSFCKVMEE